MKTISICLLSVFLFSCSSGSDKPQTIGEAARHDTAIASSLATISASDSSPDSVGEKIVAEKPVADSSAKRKSVSVQPATAFTVSFYSIGEGIESAQVELFENFLNAFRTNSKKEIPTEKISWGREGERDYCIDLSGLSGSEKTTFIRKAKDTLKASRLVHFSENSPCRQKRR